MNEMLDQFNQAKEQVEATKKEVKGLEAVLVEQTSALKTTEQEVVAAIKQEIDSRYATLTLANQAITQNDPVKAYQLLFPGRNQRIYNAFAVIIDSSGSMADHNVFDGAYEGAEEVLKSCTGQGAVINFSLNSLFSGWHRLTDLKGNRDKSVEKQLSDKLKKFQGEGTRLSEKVLKELLKQAKSPFYSILITDGVIENFVAVQKDLMKLNENGNALEMIRIGELDPGFARAMEKLGNVYNVKSNYQDVRAKIIELAKAKLN